MAEIVIPGDAGGLAALASQLGAAGDHVGAVRGRVGSNTLAGAWSGQAAEAFRSTLHQLPGELTKVEQAFGDAGRALGSFSSKLSELQGKARWYNGQIDAAQRDLETAEASHRSAESELRVARQRGGAAADPVSKHSAQNAIDAGEVEVGRAAADVDASTNRIADLERSASHLRGEYDDAVRACCAALEGIGQAGHHSLLSWAKARAKEIGKLAEHAPGAVLHAVKAGVEDVEDVGADALEAFDQHWGEWRKFLVDANGVIGDVALDVNVGLLALAGAAALVPGVGDVAAGAIVGADEELMLGVSKVQAADSALVLAGDAVDGLVMGRAQYKADLVDDVIDFGVSASGAKLSEAAISRVGKGLESVPAIKTATRKVEKAVTADPTLMVEKKIVVKEVNIVEHDVVGKGENLVKKGIKALVKPVILPPLDRAETFHIDLTPAPSPR